MKREDCRHALSVREGAKRRVDPSAAGSMNLVGLAEPDRRRSQQKRVIGRLRKQDHALVDHRPRRERSGAATHYPEADEKKNKEP